MDKTYELALAIAENYSWNFSFKDGFHIMSIDGKFDYDSPEELIADWYDTMIDSNKDYYETGNKDYMIWKDEDVEFARKIKEELCK